MKQVLVLNQRLWKVFGVLLNETASTKDKVFSVVANIYILIMLAYFAIGSILYVIIDGKVIKLENSLFGVLQCFSAASVIPSYVIIMWRKAKIAAFVNKIQSMVEERIELNNEMDKHYETTEGKAFKSAKWIFIVHYLMYPGQELFGFLMSVLYALISGNFDYSQWYVASQALRSFDRSTLKGYLLYVFFEGNLEIAFVSSHISCWTLFVGFYLYFDAFIGDFNKIFDRIDKKLKQNNINDAGSLIRAAIDFHEQIYRLFEQFSGIISGVLLFQLVFGCAYMSTTFFQADLASSHIGPDSIMIASLPLLSVETVLPYCYLATKSMNKFKDCAQIAYFSNWYDLPVGKQRAIKMITSFAQRERQFSGEGVITCSLENFATIIKTAFSYYIMIKQLTFH